MLLLFLGRFENPRKILTLVGVTNSFSNEHWKMDIKQGFTCQWLFQQVMKFRKFSDNDKYGAGIICEGYSECYAASSNDSNDGSEN